MQRHLSISKLRGRELCLPIWALTFVAAHVPAALAQWEPPSPWTKERVDALVRIEAPVANEAAPSVGTGFIVDGQGGRQYVATSTHGLLPELTEEEIRKLDARFCTDLLPETKLFQGNTGGPELRPDCGAYHIGNDMSLIELSPGTSPLLALPFLACDLLEDDTLYLGGFPLGGHRNTTFVGKVTGNGPDGMIIASFLTAPGLSGAPYMTIDGHIVAIHRGGAKYTAGYAHMVPISAVRKDLEARVQRIETPSACPNPLSYEQFVKEQLGVSEKAFEDKLNAFADRLFATLGMDPDVELPPDATIDQRIQKAEKFIATMREEIQWGINATVRRPVGPLAVIYYQRTVFGPPPDQELALTVRPILNSSDPQAIHPEVTYIFPYEHIPEVNGKRGKYDKPLNEILIKLEAAHNTPIEEVRLDLRYRNKNDLLATHLYSLSPPAMN